MEDMEKKALKPEELDKVAGGGGRRRDYSGGNQCRHDHATRTGKEREDSFFVFWSKHQYEYSCPDCKATFWRSE